MIVLIHDTETTGLIANRSMALDRQPEVIEYYGVLVDLDRKGKMLSHIHHMIRPARALVMERATDGRGKGKKTITEITGIDNAMLENKPPFSRVAREIFGYMEAAPLIIAQNASFDRDVLDAEADRLKVKIKWPQTICSIEQSIHYKGYRLNLGDLHEHLLGERFPGAHRATEDVEALLHCCVEMRKRGDL